MKNILKQLAEVNEAEIALNGINEYSVEYANKDSAESAFTKRENECNKLLKNIKKKLDALSSEFFKKGATDWGYPGDLGRVIELLSEVDEVLK
jgi:oligoendopeptidase F